MRWPRSSKAATLPHEASPLAALGPRGEAVSRSARQVLIQNNCQLEPNSLEIEDN